MKTPNFNYLRHETNFETFSTGQTIFSEGQIGKFMYFIQKGEVDIVFRDKIINTHGNGEIFGEMALVHVGDFVRSASAIAKSDCELVPIDKRHFLFLVHEHPTFALSTMEVLAYRLQKKTES